MPLRTHVRQEGSIPSHSKGVSLRRKNAILLACDDPRERTLIRRFLHCRQPLRDFS